MLAGTPASISQRNSNRYVYLHQTSLIIAFNISPGEGRRALRGFHRELCREAFGGRTAARRTESLGRSRVSDARMGHSVVRTPRGRRKAGGLGRPSRPRPPWTKVIDDGD